MAELKLEIPIEFCGDENILNSVPGRDYLRDFINKFLRKYEKQEIIDVLVYCKQFKESEKPLVFASLTINTIYGHVTTYGIDFDVKKALKTALKNTVIEVEKLAAEQLYGKYSEVEELVEA